jgi:hypothetical protein
MGPRSQCVSGRILRVRRVLFSTKKFKFCLKIVAFPKLYGAIKFWAGNVFLAKDYFQQKKKNFLSCAQLYLTLILRTGLGPPLLLSSKLASSFFATNCPQPPSTTCQSNGFFSTTTSELGWYWVPILINKSVK